MELPVLDMRVVHSRRQESARDLVSALENIGFLTITNVDGIDYTKLFQSCQWFFKLPPHVKRSLTTKAFAPENDNRFRGYFPVVPTEPSRKEAFEFGFDPEKDKDVRDTPDWFLEDSVWPPEDGAFPFQEFLKGQRDILYQTSIEILKLAAIGVGIPEDTFAHLFETNPISTFRILHYPPWDTDPPEGARLEDGRLITTPEHTDTGFMTLLTTFDFGGLEIMTQGGTWRPVTSPPNSLVMNIGDVFSRLMGGRFKATRHRVLDIGRDRYSVPFFMEPSFHADIGINFLSQFTGEGPKHVPERFGPWFIKQYKYVKKYFEYRDLPDIE